VASGTVAVDANSSGGGLAANVPTATVELVEAVEEAMADEAAEAANVAAFAIMPVPVIHLQSNQPNPTTLMAMTDDGEEPSSTGPTPQLSS
jgi:hypothetical protein